MRSVLALFALLVLGAVRVSAQAPDPSPHSDARLVSEVATVQPGTPFTVGLWMTMDPHWHSYWRNPGDSGLPTTIRWALPDGFTAGPIQWPHPKRIELPPFVSYGYEDEVLLAVEITPPASFAEGTVTLRGEADWLICEDVCLPASAPLALTLPVADGPSDPDPDQAALFEAARAARPAPATDWRIRATTSATGYTLDLVPPVAWEGPLDGLQFFADTTGVIQHAAPQTAAASGQGFQLAVARSEFATGTPERLTGVLVAPEGVTWDGVHRALAVDAPLEEGEAPAATAAGGGTALTLWTALLLAFVGGLILNLMPCVFPVLSIKILGFVQGRTSERALLRRHGLVFGAGVILSFLALAGALLVLRAGGAQLGWGFQLQNAWVVGGLGLLMVALGLNLVGVFEWGLGLASTGGRLDRGEGLGGAFWSGVLATVVATPCTAPFMGAAIGSTLTMPPLAALLVFAFLGVGMATPYVLLSLFPQWIARLPKPGPWMETLKQVLAFPMFIVAIWLVLLFGELTTLRGAAWLLLAMTTLGFAAWLLGRWTVPTSGRRARTVARGLALTSLVLVGLFTARGVRAPEAEVQTAWQPYDPDALTRLVADGQPVFVDFTATWCLSCQANKAVALRTKEVEAAFAARGVTLFEADWTRRDPAITAALESFGRSGVPLYVLYPGEGRDPILLPELLTPGLVMEALDAVPTVVAREGTPTES